MDSLGKVVVLRRGSSGPSESYAFDGSDWSLLPTATGKYTGSTLNSVEKQGWWIGGRTYTDSGSYSAEYTSEILVESDWKQGPQFTGMPKEGCLLHINETTTMLIGGHISGHYSNKVFLYDWTSNRWIDFIPLNEAKAYLGCAVLEGQGVLVVGGWNGTKLRSVELFDFHSNAWTQQPDLPKSIIDALRPVIMPHGNTVVGVFTINNKVYKRAEDGSWSPIEGITLPRKFGRNDNAFLVPNDFDVTCN